MATARSKGIQSLTRVMIVDDHPTVREGLRHRIQSQADMMVCGEAADVSETLKRIGECRPDVVIVDISLKDSDGLDLIKILAERHPSVRALVHSMYDETVYADRCLHAGALGYVNKEASPDEVIVALRAVRRGQVHLSPAMAAEILGRSVSRTRPHADPIDTLTDRQLEVFRLIGDGKTASQIAQRLHISVHTVETHREHIKRKLNVDTVAALTRMAALWGAKKR